MGRLYDAFRTWVRETRPETCVCQRVYNRRFICRGWFSPTCAVYCVHLRQAPACNYGASVLSCSNVGCTACIRLYQGTFYGHAAIAECVTDSLDWQSCRRRGFPDRAGDFVREMNLHV